MPDHAIPSFSVLDTHTGGEITRVVMAQTIGLPPADPAEQLRRLRDELDWVRRSLTSEPRGSAFAVGAVVSPCPAASTSWSIVFFNNVGYLGMCGHGLIGVVEALRHRGMLAAGTHHFATPPGAVSAELNADGGVSFTGVRSWCQRQDVSVACDDGETVTGDIAYGGNWFFLVRDDAVAGGDAARLTDRCRRIRQALAEHTIGGAGGAAIDHIELYCPLEARPLEARPLEARPLEARRLEAGAAEPTNATPPGCRNFVLCPGGHYDRSPCGTGTSAKLASLAARGELQPGQRWIQQSITGSRFAASYQPDGAGVRVTISGRAHVIADTVQIYDPEDPLRFGIGGRP